MTRATSSGWRADLATLVCRTWNWTRCSWPCPLLDAGFVAGSGHATSALTCPCSPPRRPRSTPPPTTSYDHHRLVGGGHRARRCTCWAPTTATRLCRGRSFTSASCTLWRAANCNTTPADNAPASACCRRTANISVRRSRGSSCASGFRSMSATSSASGRNRPSRRRRSSTGRPRGAPNCTRWSSRSSGRRGSCQRAPSARRS